MKNKKNIVILVTLVLFIWGFVVYQFFSLTNANDEVLTKSKEFVIKPFILKEKNTFSINVNYRDPFLGKIYQTKYISKVIKSSGKSKIISKPVEAIVWPTILYKGMISDAKGKNQVFMLVISGKDFFMKKGEVQNEILLKEGDKESIYVKYKGILNIILLAE